MEQSLCCYSHVHPNVPADSFTVDETCVNLRNVYFYNHKMIMKEQNGWNRNVDTVWKSEFPSSRIALWFQMNSSPTE